MKGEGTAEHSDDCFFVEGSPSPTGDFDLFLVVIGESRVSTFGNMTKCIGKLHQNLPLRRGSWCPADVREENEKGEEREGEKNREYNIMLKTELIAQNIRLYKQFFVTRGTRHLISLLKYSGQKMSF